MASKTKKMIKRNQVMIDSRKIQARIA